jgi:hypothetical protein
VRKGRVKGEDEKGVDMVKIPHNMYENRTMKVVKIVL